MITIQKITSQATYPVRQPVLRPGLPVESCVFEGDDLPTTVHLGLYIHDKLAGIASVFESASPLFNDEKQYQLRGMAILPEYRKQGLGEKLVNEAEKLVIENNGNLLWFNARESAAGFYKKLGYTIKGELFTIEGVGPHYVMFKKLC